MRLEMPDGTAVILAPQDGGVVVATQGLRGPDGALPQPSGYLVQGDGADLLGALIELLDDHDAETVLGTDDSEPGAAPVRA